MRESARALMVAALAASGSLTSLDASQQTLAIVAPEQFSYDGGSMSLLCRDANGAWAGVDVWRPVSSRPTAVNGPPGGRCRVLIRPTTDRRYLASAEITWEAASQPILIQPRWLRTISVPAATSSAVFWSGSSSDAALDCQAASSGMRCLFVPDEAGVLAVFDGNHLRFSVVAQGAIDSTTALNTTQWGRLIRIRSPAGAAVAARVVALQPSLKRGTGLMREVQPSSGAAIHRVGANVFWVEGGRPSAAELELQSLGAATIRLPLSRLSSSSALSLDVSLFVEEVVEGTVSSRGVPVEGATVMLARILDDGAAKMKEEERPIERVAEVRTGPSGEFRFGSLARNRYEVLAMHPTQGRARAIVTAPTFSRLVLKPRAVIHGRVVRDGAPVPGAVVQVLPSLDAVTAARNPVTLGTEPSHTDLTGRFEVVAPDEGRVTLSLTADRAAKRLELGDAASLDARVDVGDVALSDPLEVDLLAHLPDGCSLQAAGPLGAMGLTVVSAERRNPSRWIFRAPLPGRWLFAAVCGGRELALDPAIVEISGARREPILLTIRR